VSTLTQDELHGRLQGEHLRNDPQEIEKRQVGELWAARSGGKCVFRMVYLNNCGQDLTAQLHALLR
jgi:type III restriction enzyme